MRSGINFGMLLRVMGLLVIIEAAFMAVPLVTSLVYGDGDTMAFVVSILVTASVGALMTFGVRPGRRDMGKRARHATTCLPTLWQLSFPRR